MQGFLFMEAQPIEELVKRFTAIRASDNAAQAKKAKAP
jgi:hypothetical protein